MNTRFDGKINIFDLKGLSSKAAKAAFHDMQKDEDMKRTLIENITGMHLTNNILDERILETEIFTN